MFDINAQQSLISMFIFMNNLLPDSLNNLYVLNDTIHSYPTRNLLNFHLINTKWSILDKSYNLYKQSSLYLIDPI